MANIDHGFNVDILSLTDVTLITSGIINPSVTGFEAPTGSLFLQQNGTSGSLFLKIGLLDTDWKKIEGLPAGGTTGQVLFKNSNADYDVSFGPVSSGKVLQVVTGTIASGSGTTIVPLDNTIPLSSEGWQFWTQAFTPISATSKIIIEYVITVSHSTTTTTAIASIFAGTTNIGSVAQSQGSARGFTIAQKVVYSPSSTATITFSGRIGGQAGTVFVNNIGGTTLGGAMVSFYIITEVE